MPTKRFDKKHWKMVVVLLAICGAMLLLRWAAMTNENSQTAYYGPADDVTCCSPAIRLSDDRYVPVQTLEVQSSMLRCKPPSVQNVH